MAKLTYREKACRGLERLGFVPVAKPRSTKFKEYSLGPGGDVTVLYVGRTPWDAEARVLVGKQTVRYTHGRIIESHPLNQRSLDAIFSAAETKEVE